jgi:hypothetical protein
MKGHRKSQKKTGCNANVKKKKKKKKPQSNNCIWHSSQMMITFLSDL